MPTVAPPSSSTWTDFDDDDGWEDMPVIRASENPLGLDEEDEKKYKYVSPKKSTVHESQGNATGNLIDFDDQGQEWRAKLEQNESDYTRLRLDDDDDGDEAYLRTKYLFDEDKAMTPLSQMQQTKNLLTEAQRIAYVGLCALVTREMSQALRKASSKELQPAIKFMDLWALKIMGRLYYHMELETAEQKMIESLADHGVNAMDLVPALMTTHTVSNPEYDPAEAKKKADNDAEEARVNEEHQELEDVDSTVQTLEIHASPTQNVLNSPGGRRPANLLRPPDTPRVQTTANVMTPSSPVVMTGVSTSLSNTDENVTLDIRWTVLCDLFLILIADSVYDSRARVLLEHVAAKMGLGWLDVVKFEKRVTDALEIQEGAENLEQRQILDGRENAAKKRRYMMMGLATIGGGLVIGLSAGLLAPVIGAGLGAAFTTIGITGTGGFLAGAGGAAVITTGGVLTGSSIAGRGMAKRTQQVRTFDLMPLHNNKRVSCIVTVPGFINGEKDDVRLPFSVLDPIVGDVFSVLWEPEMMVEMGSALQILTSEVLSQVGTTVLQATVMTTLMTALQWPIVLTKLGYLIDNPWSNALDRAKAAGLVLADVLLNRNLGVRPITLIGFSLGARVIFYALLELARNKAMGIVQDVFIMGATVSAPTKTWHEIRGVVAGRFVNAFARSDWLLNYLFRATAGGGNTVAGLRPVDNVPGLENVDVTDKISGHLSYRVFMPLILDQLGFPVTATYFDEPEDIDMAMERMVVKEEEEKKSKSRFSFFRKSTKPTSPIKTTTSRPPSYSSTMNTPLAKVAIPEEDLPERLEKHSSTPPPPPPRTPGSTTPLPADPIPSIPKHAGFDFEAIGKVLGKDTLNPNIKMPVPITPPNMNAINHHAVPLERSESAPPPRPESSAAPRPEYSAKMRASLDEDQDVPAPKFSRSASTQENSYNNPSASSSKWTQPALTASSSGETTPWGGYTRNPFAPAPSSETLSFGGSDGSISFGGPPPPPTLSFGAVDGSISVADPWAKDAFKKPSANPWS